MAIFSQCSHFHIINSDYRIWSKINIGCIVYLTAVKDTDCTWKVTNEYGLLVYEPDILISNTAVVGMFFDFFKSCLLYSNYN